MKQLSKYNEMKANFIIAREFIEEKLGVEPTSTNIKLFVNYIINFEHQINKKASSIKPF